MNLPNTFRELQNSLIPTLKTIDVVCKKMAEDFEGYPEKNIRLTILKISDTPRDGDDVMILDVSFEKFDEVNREFESRNFYNRAGVPNLTAREANQYQVKEQLYVMADQNPNDFFELLSSPEFSPIETVTRILSMNGIPIGDVLVPEQCAEIYIGDKKFHLVLEEML